MRFRWCCWRCKCIQTRIYQRLAAQTYRFLQPHHPLNLGPTQALKAFLDREVVRLSLEELSQEPDLDPLRNLLTLPVRPEEELSRSSREIRARRPDLKTASCATQGLSRSGLPREKPAVLPAEKRR